MGGPRHEQTQAWTCRDVYLQCVAVQRRLLQTLGIRRAPIDLDMIDSGSDPAIEAYNEAMHNGD